MACCVLEREPKSAFSEFPIGVKFPHRHASTLKRWISAEGTKGYQNAHINIEAYGAKRSFEIAKNN
jgi:hypothetical protein